MALLKESALERLRAARDSNRLAHAYLVSGPTGSGKEWLSRALAAEILGAAGGDPNTHPDFHTVEPESKSRRIVIDQIRDLERSLQMKPLRGKSKVALLRDADRLQPQAANAFLKTLEEPPSGAHILLTTTLREAVLPTILSRCITIPLRAGSATQGDEGVHPLAKAFTDALLQGGGPDTAAALRFTQTFKAEMSDLREKTASELGEGFKEQLKHYRDSIDPEWRESREDQIKAQGESIVLRERERLLGLAGGVLASALRETVRPSPGCRPEIRRIAEANGAKLLLRRLDALARLRRLLGAGVQETLALESGFLQTIADP